MQPGSPLSVGHLLDGRYRIHKVLGVGGMGRVYLANDTRLANRPVAAKEMIIGDGVRERKAVEDFNREASVLARLSHPAIPQVIDYFAEQGRHYLVMEYVAGGDLQGRLDQIGAGARLPEPQVLSMARQLLEVLQFLHSQKPTIIYRDLKPANIMIDQHGRAMLVDFGIARFLPPGGRGTQIGSLGYAPPEQYLGKMEPRSDLYALAATMHHLLSGRDPQLEPPFSFPPLSDLAPEVSAQTARVVMNALDKEIASRPSSAREMRDALPIPPAGTALEGSGAWATLSADRAKPAIGAIANIVLKQPPPQSRAPTPRSLVSTVGPRKVGSVAPGRKDKLVPAGPSARSAAPVATKRRLSLAAVEKPSPGRVSSTAKTSDLGLKNQNPHPDPLAQSTSPRRSRKGAGEGQAGSGREADQRLPAASRFGSALSTMSAAIAAGPLASRVSVARADDNGNGYLASQPEIGAARLVALADGLQFALLGSRLVVGRAEATGDSVDIDLSGLRRGVDRISRRHAEIIKQGGDYFIRDLGSVNGTYVAGRGRLGRDQLYKLKDRDELVFGSAKLEFRRG
jgi:serine/threonine protein kinase